MLGVSEGRIGFLMDRNFPTVIRTHIPTLQLLGVPVLQMYHAAVFLTEMH